MDKNVFGEPLEICCTAPMTGYFRDGLCRTITEDTGTHTVCAVMTNDFLSFSASRGNALISPMPYFHLPCFNAGDKSCRCVSRWIDAAKKGKAPSLVFVATHEKDLDFAPLQMHLKYTFKEPSY